MKSIPEPINAIPTYSPTYTYQGYPRVIQGILGLFGATLTSLICNKKSVPSTSKHGIAYILIFSFCINFLYSFLENNFTRFSGPTQAGRMHTKPVKRMGSAVMVGKGKAYQQRSYQKNEYYEKQY